MRKLAFTIVVCTALILVGLDMLNHATVKTGDLVLVLTLSFFMVLASCIALYGLYLERHKLNVYVMRRWEVRMRLVPRMYRPRQARLPMFGRALLRRPTSSVVSTARIAMLQNPS
jgi:hypothetical protein